MPHDWRDTGIVSIYKNKGAHNNCNSYRGISLLAMAGKIYGRILMNRTVQHTLLYGSQSLVTYRRHTSKLGAFHLRHIAGIQWQEGIPNTEVLKITENNGLLSANRLNGWVTSHE